MEIVAIEDIDPSEVGEAAKNLDNLQYNPQFSYDRLTIRYIYLKV